MKTYLIADCGTTTTTVVMFQMADGLVRLIGRAYHPSTQASGSILNGIKYAIRELEQQTGYEILTDDGELIRTTRQVGRGIDDIEVVTSAFSPLSVIIVSSSEQDPAVDSMRRAVQIVPSRILDVFTSEDDRTVQEKLAALISHEPELICITSGSQRRSERDLHDQLKMLSIGMRQFPPQKQPRVMYAGDEKWADDVQQILTDFVRVNSAANIRPSKKNERLGEAKNLVFELATEKKMGQVAGMSDLVLWGQCRPTMTSYAIDTFTRYAASITDNRVLAIDVGASQLTISYASPETSHSKSFPNLGIGAATSTIEQTIPAAEILKWVPRDAGEKKVTAQFETFLANKMLYPHTIPLHPHDVQFTHAILKTMIAHARAAFCTELWGKPDTELQLDQLIICGRPLTSIGDISIMMGILLDSLQPSGTFHVMVDKYGILPQVGALASIDPAAMIQSSAQSFMSHAGWCLSLPPGRFSRRVAQVKFEPEGDHEPIDIEAGKLQSVSLQSRPSKDITIQPERRLDIGVGRGTPIKLNQITPLTTLIFDTRSKPINVPSAESARLETLNLWSQQLRERA